MSVVGTVRVLPIGDDDRAWLGDLIESRWGLPVVSVSRVYDDPAALDGFIAWLDGERAGAVTFMPDPDGAGCEVVTLNAVLPGRGVGRALVEAVRDRAAADGIDRVWLITTTDLTGAIGFYEHLGMRRGRTWPAFDRVVRAAKPALPADLAFDAIEFEWVSR